LEVRNRVGHVTVIALDIAAAGVAAWLVLIAIDRRFVTVPDTSLWAAAVVSVAGAACAVTAALAGRRAIVSSAAFAFVSPILLTVLTGSDWPRVAARSLGWLIPGLLVVGVRAASARSRQLAAGVLAGGVATAAAEAFLVDPFRIIDCGRDCAPNTLVVGHHPGLVTVGRVVIAVAIAAWLVAVPRSHPWRIGGAIGASVVVLSSSNWLDRFWSSGPADEILIVVAGVSFVSVSASLTLDDLRLLHARRRIRTAAREIDTTARPGGVEQLLRRALREPTLTIAYVTADGRTVNTFGRAVASHGGPTSPLTYRGELVALVSTASAHDLQAALSPTVVLALENERLLAQANTQLSDLQASRKRIVERADVARHQLERDLHDGAQQRLLSVTMLLAQAQPGEQQRRAGAEARAALDDLRRIAHGLDPVSLDQLGLAAALSSYADEAPLPIVVQVDELMVRPAPEVERVVYRVVMAFSEVAALVGARRVGAVVSTTDDGVRLELDHDGATCGDLTDVEDRVGAIGGIWTLTSHAGHHLGVAAI
jgi:signal transduction histidine kinase